MSLPTHMPDDRLTVAHIRNHQAVHDCFLHKLGFENGGPFNPLVVEQALFFQNVPIKKLVVDPIFRHRFQPVKPPHSSLQKP